MSIRVVAFSSGTAYFLGVFFSNQNSYTIPDCTNSTIPAITAGSEIGQPAVCGFGLGVYTVNTDTWVSDCPASGGNCQLWVNSFSINYGAASLGTTMTSSNPVAGVIEYMAVLLGEDDYGQRDANGNKAMTVSRWVTPPAYATNAAYPGSSLIDLTNVVAVRIAFVVRSDDAILANLPSVATPLNLMKGTGGTMLQYTPPADQYMRKVFVITIPFTNFLHRNYPNDNAFTNTLTNTVFTSGVDYERHCVANTPDTGYSIKVGGVRTNPITAASGDRCCSTNGTSCKFYSTLTLCETDRISSSYGGNCGYFYQHP